jgi:type II secretory pathway pseudopilin PulG
MCRAKNNKGFTMVELIIAITVLMVIMGTVMGLVHRMSAAAAEQRRRQAQHTVEEQARMALLSIVRDIRLSSTVDTSPPTGILQLNSQLRVQTGNPLPGDFESVAFTIIYELNVHEWVTGFIGDGADAYIETGILNRTVTAVGFTNDQAEDFWPNRFIAAVAEDITFNEVATGRYEIFVDVLIPDTDINATRDWGITTRVSSGAQRMPIP